MTTNSGRLKTVMVDERALIEVLTGTWKAPDGFAVVMQCPGMPADTRLVSVGHDPYRRCFVAMVEHESFGRVDPGCEVPFFGSMIESRVVALAPMPPIDVVDLSKGCTVWWDNGTDPVPDATLPANPSTR